MHIWLVNAEPLIRGWVALRIYVEPILIVFLILINVLEVKVRIDATVSMIFADIELCIETLVHKTECFVTSMKVREESGMRTS